MGLRTRLARALLRGLSDGSVHEFVTSIVGGGSQKTTPRLGTAQLLQAYSTMPWLRSVVSKVSFSVASTTWCLYVAQRKTSGKSYQHHGLQQSMNPMQRRQLIKSMRERGELREIESHQALDFLQVGNAKFPGLVGMSLTQTYLDTVGECAWILEFNGLRKPVEWYPIPPTWIQELPSSRNGNVWKIQTPTGLRDYAEDEILYIYHPDPADPYKRGTGTAHTLSDELETDEYAAKHLKMYFRNRARPDVLITGKDMKSEDIERLEQRWMEKLSGYMGQFKPHFMNREVKVDVLSQNFKDMQLSELRKDQRDILIHTYGFPPELFGILESSNRATITAAEYLYTRHVVVPRNEFLRVHFQTRLVNRWDERLILDYVDPVASDPEQVLNVMKAAPHAYTVDEWRGHAGHGPMEDESAGKLHSVPINVILTEDLRKIADQEPPTPEEDDEDVDAVVDDEDDDAEEDVA